MEFWGKFVEVEVKSEVESRKLSGEVKAEGDVYDFFPLVGVPPPTRRILTYLSFIVDSDTNQK